MADDQRPVPTQSMSASGWFYSAPHEPAPLSAAPPSNYKSDDDDGVHTVGEFIAAFAALDPDLPVWLDNGECRSWPAQLPVALPVPVMRTDYPESVSHMVPGVWLS